MTDPDVVEATRDCPHCRHSGTTRGEAPQWHLRKGPLPVLDEHCRRPGYPGSCGNRSYSGAREFLVPDWIDHPYRFRLDDGRWCYVAEPYDLYAEALPDLIALVAAGFDVKISAEWARHYPGQTIAVMIFERRPALKRVS